MVKPRSTPWRFAKILLVATTILQVGFIPKESESILIWNWIASWIWPVKIRTIETLCIRVKCKILKFEEVWLHQGCSSQYFKNRSSNGSMNTLLLELITVAIFLQYSIIDHAEVIHVLTCIFQERPSIISLAHHLLSIEKNLRFWIVTWNPGPVHRW